MSNSDNPGDQRPNHDTPRDTDAPGNGNRKRTVLLAGLAAVFLLAGLAWGAYWFFIGQFYVTTNDAYVHGNRIMLTPQISGTVVSINAEDTDRVERGQPLIELDRSNTTVALARAEADLARSVREVRRLYAQARAQQARVDRRATGLDQARRDYERDRELLDIKGVSRKQFQHSRLAYDSAKAQLRQARDELAALQAATENTTLREHPRVRAAIAAFEDAYLNLRRTTIPAPVSGTIAQRQVQLGQKVDPSKPMLSIVPMNQMWVQANFKETELARMRLGQSVELTADFYGDDVTYHGHIVGIHAGTGSAFELLPPQNATGNWIKIVQRVPVRIRLDPEEVARHPLRLGLSMRVSVDVHDTGGAALPDIKPSGPVYQTRVYQRPKAELDRRVEAIIAANSGDDAEPATAAATP